MAIFNSHVSLPEGSLTSTMENVNNKHRGMLTGKHSGFISQDSNLGLPQPIFFGK